jgi:hypothetical protein
VKEISFQPVPEATSDDDIERGLHKFATTDMPAFLIRHAADHINAALGRIKNNNSLYFDPQNDPTDSHLEVNNDYDTPNDKYTNDLGLHIDIDYKLPEPDTAINAWHLMCGKVVGSFFYLGPSMLKTLRSDREAKLPDYAVSLYRDGLVDPQILKPQAYRSELMPGDLIIVKDGHPIAHDYRTIGFSERGMRLARSRLGRLYGRQSFLDRDQ